MQLLSFLAVERPAAAPLARTASSQIDAPEAPGTFADAVRQGDATPPDAGQQGAIEPDQQNTAEAEPEETLEATQKTAQENDSEGLEQVDVPKLAVTLPDDSAPLLSRETEDLDQPREKSALALVDVPIAHVDLGDAPRQQPLERARAIPKAMEALVDGQMHRREGEPEPAADATRADHIRPEIKAEGAGADDKFVAARDGKGTDSSHRIPNAVPEQVKLDGGAEHARNESKARQIESPPSIAPKSSASSELQQTPGRGDTLLEKTSAQPSVAISSETRTPEVDRAEQARLPIAASPDLAPTFAPGPGERPVVIEQARNASEALVKQGAEALTSAGEAPQNPINPILNSGMPIEEVGQGKAPAPHAMQNPQDFDTRYALSRRENRAADPSPDTQIRIRPVAPTPTLVGGAKQIQPIAGQAQTAAESLKLDMRADTEARVAEFSAASLDNRTAVHTSATLSTGAPARADTALQIARQMADAFPLRTDRPTELSLSPEELGRVRMVLATADGIVTLSITAERPETLDLMRRHIEQLSDAFGQIGFHEMAFAFSDGAEGEGDLKGDSDHQSSPAISAQLEDVEAEVIHARPASTASGLDIRL